MQAGLDVIRQDDLGGGVQRRPHGGELDQDVRTVPAFFHHTPYRPDVPLRAFEALDYRLALLMLVLVVMAVDVLIRLRVHMAL